MHRDDPPDLPWPASEQVALLLARVEGSAGFRGSARHRTLLRHLVEQAQAGALSALKETVIAVEVFGRPASRFDPRSDSIVRVETRRLRARLARFFDGEGQDLAWRIELPVGSYVPQVVARPPAPDRRHPTGQGRSGPFGRRRHLAGRCPEHPRRVRRAAPGPVLAPLFQRCGRADVASEPPSRPGGVLRARPGAQLAGVGAAVRAFGRWAIS